MRVIHVQKIQFVMINVHLFPFQIYIEGNESSTFPADIVFAVAGALGGMLLIAILTIIALLRRKDEKFLPSMSDDNDYNGVSL